MIDPKIISYVRDTLGAEPLGIEAVTGGLSPAEKYKMHVLGSDWMVKLFDADKKRELWYRELSRLECPKAATPRACKLFENGTLCVISPWIEGESLGDILMNATPSEARAYGKEAAKILLGLHERELDYPEYRERLKERIYSACESTDALGLTFPGHEECLSFLKGKAESHAPRSVSFVHKDLRPENLILKDGELHLIDFDNGSLGERASDFSYLTTMVVPEHKIFSKALVEEYLKIKDIPSFWEDNLLYSTLQVVEYAIWKWNTKGRQVYFQAENLMRQYSAFSSRIPLWWQEA